MRLLRAAVIIAALIVPPHSGQAADAVEPLWHKSCGQDADGRLFCAVEQFAVAMPQKTVLLHISFSMAAAPNEARMIVTAPLGVLLASGLTLSIDGAKPIALPFERCTEQGCEAAAALDQSALAQFSRGKTLTVRYAVSDAKAADVPIRLQGFTDALKSLAK